MTPDEFRAARKAMGHTGHSLAAALKMGKHGWQTISAWENGKQSIPGPVQVAMEHLANCAPERTRNGKTLGKTPNHNSDESKG